MSAVAMKLPTTTTTIVSGWTGPENAYAEDGVNTYSSTNNAEQKYGGWNYTETDIPAGSTITKVEMGAKHYEVNPTGYYHYTVLKHVNSAGSTWTVQLNQRASLTWDWIDITSHEPVWNVNVLNAVDGRIVMKAVALGAGCIVETEDEKAFIIAKENGLLKLKTIGQTKVGDEVLICDYTAADKGKRWMLWSRVIEKQEQKLVQEDVVEIWSGVLNLGKHLGEVLPKTKGVVWRSHITVTKQQPIHVFILNGEGKPGRVVMPAEQVYAQIQNNQAERLAINHLWFNWTVKPFPLEFAAVKTVTGKAYNLKFAEQNVGLFFKTLKAEELRRLEEMGLTLKKQAELGPPFLAIQTKQTVYVDAVALRVTYTPPAAAGQPYNVGDGLTNKTVTV